MKLLLGSVALLASGCFFELEPPIRAETCDGPETELSLVTTGNTWKYLDTGEFFDGWTSPSFDDSAWKSGPSELGYGDDNEATVVGYGPNPDDKFVTTYFRHTFAAPTCIVWLLMELKRDDGAVVYVNGMEVMRSNMPGGIITPQTRPETFVSSNAELTFHPADIEPSLVVAGTNLVAAEVHQLEPDGTDISFDLRLTATTTQR